MAGDNLTANITIQDVEYIDSIAVRHIVLSEPDWSIKIGRGSSTGDDALRPAENNAWFDSRVMSRNHAVLRADPTTKEIFIEDTDSMHGTQCSGSRLIPNVLELIRPHDSLIFGADVIRGSAQFRALKVSIDYSWSDRKDDHQDSQSTQWLCSSKDGEILPVSTSFPNTFATPGYSDDDADQDHSSDEEPANWLNLKRTNNASTNNADPPPANTDVWADYNEDEHLDGPDDDVQFVKESYRAASVEIVVPQREGSVVASEYSDHASSYFSEGEEGESPTSSPTGLNDEQADKITCQESAKAVHAETLSLTEQLEDAAHEHFPTVAHPQSSHYVQLESDDLYENSEEEDVTIPQSDRPFPDTMATFSALLKSNRDAKLPPVNQTFAELRPYDSARAPSPSEVAMVKPMSDLIQQQPFMPPLAPLQTPSHMIQHLNEPRVQLCCSRQHSPTSPCNSYWEPQGHHLSSPQSPQYVPTTPLCSSYTGPFGGGATTCYDNSFPSTSTLTAKPFNSSPVAPMQEGQSTLKFSILPKQSDNVGEETKLMKSLKRKADDMSDIAEHRRPSEGLGLSISKNDLEVKPETTTSSTRYPGIEHEMTTTSTLVADTPANSIPDKTQEESDLPPRKKVKKTQSPDHGSFMKIAVATITGVAIGTVGTIIGLASLPQDYFL
ncbi:hypothetical protein LTR84_009342 [Exophiala bonariae]|uniref:FHA domain-containing protein n=1 Tax=Exophiala bonariae TaxID=1690606 RepID=A0AAV9MUN1_9EURO|nr:hypothetical protein LTR84_009342 [Exophiala bonariae]